MLTVKSAILALAVPMFCGMLVSEAAAWQCRQVKIDPKCWGDICKTRMDCKLTRVDIVKRFPAASQWKR